MQPRSIIPGLALALAGCHADPVPTKPVARWGQGPVIADVQIEAIFWNADYAWGAAIRQLYPALLATSYLSTLAEYATPASTIGPGSYLGAFQDTNPSTQLDQAAIQAELDRLFELASDAGIDAGPVPLPTADALYTIFFPPGVTVTFEDAQGQKHTSCAGGELGWCGAHQSYQAVVNGVSVTANYALVADCAPLLPPHGSTACQTDADCASAGAGFYCYPGSNRCIQNPCGDPGDSEQDWNTVNATRELVDAITNPNGSASPQGWQVSGGPSPLEIGEACRSLPPPAAAEDLVSGFKVATFFSDAFNACTDNILPAPYQQLLLYDAARGEIDLAAVDTAGTITDETVNPGFRGLTAIVPGQFFGDAGTDVFLFDGDAGDGAFYNVDAKGALHRLSGMTPVADQRTGRSEKGATIVVAGNFTPSSPSVSGLFFYNPGVRAGTFYEVSTQDGGAYALTAIGAGLTGMSPTWATIEAGEFDGNGCTDLLLYDPADAGSLAFTTTDCQGNAAELISIPGAEPGYTSLVAGNFLGAAPGGGADKPPLWDVLAYTSGTGKVQLWIDDGPDQSPAFSPAAPPPYTSTLATSGWAVVAGQELGGNDFGGLEQADLNFTDLLFFDPSSGVLSLATSDGLGDFVQLSNSSGWSSTITQVKALRQPLANVQSLY